MAKKPEEENVLDTIRDLKHREPFTPFRVVMTSGESQVVEHPDSLAMNDSQLFYCMPRSGRVIYMRLNQIAAIDDPGEPPVRRRRTKKTG